jgi:molecular chaperone DnaK
MKKISPTQKNAIKKNKVADVAVGCFGVIEKIDGEDKVVVLINKGVEIPCSVTRSYFTEYDNQTSINLTITQANDPTDDPKWVQIVWDGNLDLPSGRPAGQEVKVTYSYDENCVMHASFLDVASGKETETSLSALGPSSDSNKIDKFTVDTEPKTESNKICAFVGINLGAVHSSISYINDTGRPQIIRNSEGQESTPSCILVEGDTVIVGLDARRELGLSGNVLARFQRDMGKKGKKYEVDGKEFTPTDCSALILKKLLQDAQASIGEIGEAVVTIPANFTNEARVETLTAAKLAGFKVEHIVAEPIAAALYYAFKSGFSFEGYFAIYSLGGGTFDVSIIKVEGQNINVLDSAGVQKLGGDDFDVCLQKIVKKKFKDEHGEKLVEQDYTKTDAEEDKKSLSKREQIHVRSNKKNIAVTRTEFEREISSLVTLTEMLCESILSDQNLTVKDLQEVFLVGGNTKIPLVEDTVKRIFGKTPVKSDNVDEVVVLGASLYAAYKVDPSNLNLAQKEVVDKIKVTDSADDYSIIDKFLVD